MQVRGTKVLNLGDTYIHVLMNFQISLFKQGTCINLLRCLNLKGLTPNDRTRSERNISIGHEDSNLFMARRVECVAGKVCPTGYSESGVHSSIQPLVSLQPCQKKAVKRKTPGDQIRCSHVHGLVKSSSGAVLPANWLLTPRGPPTTWSKAFKEKLPA